MQQLLKDLDQALTDWVNTYASELCYPETVEASYKRIMEGGGTLAYIGQLLERIRKEQQTNGYEKEEGTDF